MVPGRHLGALDAGGADRLPGRFSFLSMPVPSATGVGPFQDKAGINGARRRGQASGLYSVLLLERATTARAEVLYGLALFRDSSLAGKRLLDDTSHLPMAGRLGRSKFSQQTALGRGSRELSGNCTACVSPNTTTRKI